LAVAGVLALLARHRWPVPVLAATLIAFGAYHLLDYPAGPPILAVVVAVYGTAASGRLSVALGAGGLVTGSPGQTSPPTPVTAPAGSHGRDAGSGRAGRGVARPAARDRTRGSDAGPATGVCGSTPGRAAMQDSIDIVGTGERHCRSAVRNQATV
jgi:hypothetical protein